MPDEIQITLLGNTGILVTWGGVRLLVDGLYRPEDYPFSQVPEPLRENLLTGQAPLGEIHYLLFTHTHPDHFHAGDLSRYLAATPVRGLFLPRPSGGQETARISPRTPLFPLVSPVGGVGVFSPEPGIKVTAFNTGHMGGQYRDMDNYCLLLRLGNRRLLITADADFRPDIFALAAEAAPLDAVVVNPLFYQHRLGQAIINDLLRPKALLLYHIPFDGDDTTGLRTMAERQQRRGHDLPYAVHALTEPAQTLRL